VRNQNETELQCVEMTRAIYSKHSAYQKGK